MVKAGRRISLGDRLMHNTIIVLMVLLSICFLYPLWQTVVRSFSSARTANTNGLKLWPSEFTLDAYKFVFRNQEILIGLKNTASRTVIGTLLSVFFTYCGSYGLSRRDLPGKSFITFYVILTMFIGAGLIPTYLNIRSLGLLNTFWVWVLPGIASAWNLIICRNFIQALPYELEESAMIDGAHPLRVIFQILLPLSMPILAVLTLWGAVGHWNSWFDAMIYTPEKSMTLLQLVVRRLIITTSVDESNTLSAATADITSTSIKCSTIVICTMPIIVLYPFLQKYFVKGVMVGALKG
ncbi:sugar ABC transporter permease [Clostridia bacterium]|nr:sugar ABC transporter permease [Clostridia bacterium]